LVLYGRVILAVVSAYALGCISTGYYLTRWRTGRDLRACGSSSTGARNAGRILGRLGFVVTFLGDFAKGILAVFIAERLLGAGSWAVILTLLAVALGHIWPVQLGFVGGKGVSVTLGALLVFDYRLVLAVAAVAAILYIGLRRFVLCGLLALAALPLSAWRLGQPPVAVIGLSCLAALLLTAHRTNLRKIIHETRAAAAPRPEDSPKAPR